MTWKTTFAERNDYFLLNCKVELENESDNCYRHQLFMCLKSLPNENLRNFSSTMVNILTIFPNIVLSKKEFLRGNILDTDSLREVDL